MAMELTEKNFQEEVINAPGPVLVDFWAPWCGPCRMMAPIVDEIARDYEGKLKVGKVNTDENQSLAERYRVMSIPTFIIFKNGQPVDRITGAMPKQALIQHLTRWIA